MAPIPALAACASGELWLPISSATTALRTRRKRISRKRCRASLLGHREHLNQHPKAGDVLPQTLMPQAFPVGHIHPVGGGPFNEGCGQRSVAILRDAEGQVKIRAGPLPAQRPGAIELQSADLGELLPLLREDHFPASWPLLQICGKGSQRRRESFPDQGQSLLGARHVIEMGHQVA